MSSMASGGMSIETCLPMTSSAVYPRTRSAPRFQLVMMPSRVFVTMISSDDSTTAASRSFRSSARLCSVTSRKTRTTPVRFPPSR